MTTFNRTKQRKVDLWLFIIGALLFAYTAVRASLLAITWDEAYTYIEFVRNGKMLLHVYDPMSANNHFLNTWCIRFFTKIFGVSELVMRLHILLAHLLFLFFSALLLKNISTKKAFIIAAFVVVNVNPYMLDFFSVARGYGLSIGLMMVSLYCFYLMHVKEKKNTYAITSILFAGLAVLANFVLLNYCVVLFGLIVLLYFYNAAKSGNTVRQKTNSLVKGLIVPAFMMALLLLFILPVAFRLKAADALYFGGNTGFWADTICSVINRLSYNYWLHGVTKSFVLLIIPATAIVVIIRFIKKNASPHTLFLTSLLLLICLCCLSGIVQHSILKTPYLIDRTVLFLVVLFNILFVFFIAGLSEKKPVVSGFAYLAAVLATAHFLATFNLDYVEEWKMDCNTKEMLTDLEKIKSIPENKETVSIGIPLIFDPTINFYREKNNLTWLNAVSRNQATDLRQDYFFLTQKELLSMNKDSVEIIKTYRRTQNVLAKPRYPPGKIKVALKKELNFEHEKQGGFSMDKIIYSPGFSFVVTDSIAPDAKAVIDFNAEVMAPDTDKDNLLLVISFENSKGELYSWQKAYIKDFIKSPMAWYATTFTCLVPEKTRAGDQIKAYIWNPENHLLYIKQMKLKWLTYN